MTRDAARTAMGGSVPTPGIGTWQNTDPQACATAIETAVEMGYRHVDTAQAYGNEADVGRGIAAADVDRDDVFLATKVWIDNLAYDDVIESTHESLEKLDVEYLDLLYVHWPAGAYDPAETLPAFQALHDEGLIDRIGVSNFEPRHLDRARSILDAPIAANQVEMHPLLQQSTLREYAAAHDIELVAYSPLARGAVFDVPAIQRVAGRHDVSEAQVSLAWLHEKGAVSIPKATGEDHIRDNWESRDLELTEADIETIDGIDRQERQVDPDFGPWN
ncbi:Aldo/keto reductase, related to diketogulonate reductase [Halanaeroarchaeum sp. HSR-CO]|uniref:aldo/keto reductase n=1 Tax=Halanaeroarchaeum sp. HSR-CO TaxID=2866382 RepID=UPI00217E931B|nr:aldo/keto reductase [Halanaeroarchaeum sp. HSR-CO]UWG47382.1 Aldo/keto reductase, related to diketogulonate reductase [Halanaeroarchaeum sp. HSR-CO]